MTDLTSSFRTVLKQTIPGSPVPNPISPVLEFIEVVEPGRFAAHFGYNVPGTTAETEPVGDQNKFTPEPQDRGQPRSFAAGRHRDVFSVPFQGGNLVWTLRGRTSTAAPAGIILVFAVAIPREDGLKEVRFSYNNPGKQTVFIASGPLNLLNGSADTVQTEFFLPGQHDNAFAVVIAANDTARWEVLGLGASA